MALTAVGMRMTKMPRGNGNLHEMRRVDTAKKIGRRQWSYNEGTGWRGPEVGGVVSLISPNGSREPEIST